ncbi:MAG: hypothetical protein P8Y12_05510, partial [Gammaproteobacteria bacterium]
MSQTAESPQQSNWWQSWHQDSPHNTRDQILYAAFCEVHLNGFQAASIQNIIGDPQWVGLNNYVELFELDGPWEGISAWWTRFCDGFGYSIYN